MRALLKPDLVEPFNTKAIYKRVLEEFDKYNSKQFFIQGKVESNTTQNYDLHEEMFLKRKTDPTGKAATENEEAWNYIHDFERKINFAKSQFTDDEMIIYKRTIENRELDKEIMDIVCKDEHKYYRIKKSCYSKIALCLGFIRLKTERKTKAVPLIAQ